MNNLGLYLSAVLIWGSTWLVITFQLGTVPPEVSVAYRFALAGVMLLLWSLVRQLRLKFSLREHGWMALQGVLLFGLNYVCVYFAESRISSGLVAVVFSLITFHSRPAQAHRGAVNSRVVRRPSRRSVTRRMPSTPTSDACHALLRVGQWGRPTLNDVPAGTV